MLSIFILLIYSCKYDKKDLLKEDNVTKADTSFFEEQFRPQFHFSPKNGWMNDPNGLVYNKGIYHLFYQYYPDSIVWGPMHWGHAVSKDLIHWKHKPIALFPDGHGYIFSGSAVVDKKNSSGFGTEEKPPLVAIFTYHLMKGEKVGRNDFQTQGIAYSLDNGDTWVKYEDNPVIKNTGIRDFRDPKVFWDEDNNQWILVLVAGDHAQFYRSDNLKEWQYLSSFGKYKGAHGGVWECPDLFKIKVKDIDEEKWVLLVSMNPGAPNGGSGTQYFVGDFDGKAFTTDQTDVKWIDYGADNYAGVTYNNEPDDKRTFIGWMSNWNYAQQTPTSIWRSAMTLPRELTLIKEGSSYFLQSMILKAFDDQLERILVKDTIQLKEPFVLKNKNFNQTKISFNTQILKQFQVAFKNNKNESLIFSGNPSKNEFILDRRKSGNINFEERFANSNHTMPYTVSDREVNVQIIMDWSSIEIVIDNGKYLMTEQIFPSENFNELKISSTDESISTNFNLYTVKSIWNEK